jgi:hypothetical protein
MESSSNVGIKEEALKIRTIYDTPEKETKKEETKKEAQSALEEELRKKRSQLGLDKVD